MKRRRRRGFSYQQALAAIRPELLLQVQKPATAGDPTENRPPRIAPAASEGIGPTRGTSGTSARQRGDTAAGDPRMEANTHDK
jgi:hypothetical protein